MRVLLILSMIDTEEADSRKIKFLEAIPEYTGSCIGDDWKLLTNSFILDTDQKTIEPFRANDKYKVVFAYLDAHDLETNILNFKDCINLYGGEYV